MEVHNMYYGKLCMIYAHIIREKKLKYITASYWKSNKVISVVGLIQMSNSRN